MGRHFFWTAIRNHIKNNQQAILVIMVHAEGSGPNAPGSKRVIFSDGTLMGTIGGGSSEYAVTEKAKTMLLQPESPNELMTLSHQENVSTDKSGMICGGSQSYALIRLNIADLATLDTLATAEQERRPIKILITEFGLGFDPSAERSRAIKWETISGTWLYEETLFVQPVVSIVGGGHVGLALSKALSDLDFTIHVYDNRPDLVTMKENAYAHGKWVVNYDDIGTYIQGGSLTYIVVMTFAHQHDEAVLSRLLSHEVRYIGMMGSPRKVAQIRSNLLAAGFSDSAIDRIHMPIGIPINSQTPEEIAISIAAQLIQIKNQPH